MKKETASKKNSNLIKRSDAIRLITNYKGLQFQSIQKDGRRGGKYVLFSRTAIQNFINALPKDCDGVRIYFGTTDPDYRGPASTTSSDYGNCMTAILVACKKESTNEYVDIIDDTSQKLEAQEFIGIAVGLNQPGFDFGTLCPPETKHSITVKSKSLANTVYGD
jgi:hypothetical protein